MKTIEIKSKRVAELGKTYIYTYRVTTTDQNEARIRKLLETSTLYNPQELFKLLYTNYDSRLISSSRKKV